MRSMQWQLGILGNISAFAYRQRYPYTGLNRPLGLQEIETPRISKQSAHEDVKVVSPKRRPSLHPGDIPRILPISARG